MMTLVQRLSEREHEVLVNIRPECNCRTLKRCIDQGYIHLRFPDTRGGTDLYVVLDAGKVDVSHGNLDQGTGTVTLSGSLTLDYVPVSCHATIDLGTLKGTGILIPLQKTS